MRTGAGGVVAETWQTWEVVSRTSLMSSRGWEVTQWRLSVNLRPTLTYADANTVSVVIIQTMWWIRLKWGAQTRHQCEQTWCYRSTCAIQSPWTCHHDQQWGLNMNWEFSIYIPCWYYWAPQCWSCRNSCALAIVSMFLWLGGALKPNYPVYLIVLTHCLLGSFGNCIYHHETTWPTASSSKDHRTYNTVKPRELHRRNEMDCLVGIWSIAHSSMTSQ